MNESTATICFLVNKDKVALALKKTKLGQGLLNGYGGHIEEGETSRQAAIRELHEECGITTKSKDLDKRARIDFYHEAESKLLFSCDIYLVTDWEGEPHETEEMGPVEWFGIEKLPLDRMLAGDQKWFPQIFEDKYFKAKLVYSKDLSEVLKYEVSFS